MLLATYSIDSLKCNKTVIDIYVLKVVLKILFVMTNVLAKARTLWNKQRTKNIKFIKKCFAQRYNWLAILEREFKAIEMYDITSYRDIIGLI